MTARLAWVEKAVNDDKPSQEQMGESLNTVLERAKVEWEAAFDSISEGIATVEPDGRVRRVNKALASLLGRDVRQMVGQNCCDLFVHHRNHEGACPVRNHPGGDQGGFEVFFPDYRYYEDSVHPIARGGRTLGFVITVRNATREQMAKQERKHLYLRIEEAGRKQKAAEEARDGLHRELKRSERAAALGNLGAVVFSELNRTLRMVHDGLQVVRIITVDDDGGERERAETVIEELTAATARSNQILDKLGLLRVDEADTGSSIRLNDLLTEVVQEARTAAQDAGVPLNLEQEDLAETFGNRGQIKAVFSSIVLNAIDAARDGEGSVTVVAQRDGEFTQIEVSDTGKGIEAEHLPQIFNPFFTTSPQSTRVGLGLTICLAIVQAHRGHIEVDSQATVGTTVKLLLPVADSPRG